MKYKNQGVTPDHTLTIRMTKQEKKYLLKLQKKLNSENDCHVSVSEIVREAVIEKIKQLNLEGKKLKKKEEKKCRISIPATNKLFQEIKLATQMSTDKSISDFMRNAIFEYHE